MRISDWSSDVCSSDLVVDDAVHRHLGGGLVERRRIGRRGGDLPGELVFPGQAFARPLDADLVQLHAWASVLTPSAAWRLALRMSRQAEPRTKTRAVISSHRDNGYCRTTMWSQQVR